MRKPKCDGRFRVLPEYDRDGTITGWNITLDGADLGFFYQHDRAMTVAQRMARDRKKSEEETCPYPDPIRCRCPIPGRGHRT